MAIRDSKESYNRYMREYHLKRYYQKREKAIQQLGGKCEKCGRTENLQLDHKDNTNKSFEISRLLSVSKEAFEKELKKCQVLCIDCHSLKSILEQGKKPAQGTHGTLSSYRYCKCDICRKAKSEYNKKYSKRLLS